MLDKNGKFKELSSDRKSETKAKQTAIYIPAEFEQGTIDLKIVINAEQHVSGLLPETHGSATQAAQALNFLRLLSTEKKSAKQTNYSMPKCLQRLGHSLGGRLATRIATQYPAQSLSAWSRKEDEQILPSKESRIDH